MRSRLFVPAALGGLLFVVLISGRIAGGGRPAPREGEAVVVLSPHWEGIIKEFSWAFSRWIEETTGKKAHVEHLDVGGGTGVILRYIESEFSANPDTIGVDVIFGGGSAPHEYLAEKGWLQPVRLGRRTRAGLPEELGGVRLRDARGRWFAAALSGFGVVSNRRIIERMRLPAVNTWRDLTDPWLFGWVASGDPSSSGSVRATWELVLQAYGFEEGYSVLVRMAGNVPAFDEGGNSAPRAVALGQAAYGMCIDFYGLEQVAAYGPENVGFTLPKDFTVITPDPIAVLKGAPHRKLAVKFVEFVLSEEAQRLWYVLPGTEGGPEQFSLNRLPVRPSLYNLGLPTAITVNPFRTGRESSFDQSLARRRGRILEDLARATILDVHRGLRRAWRAIIDAGCPEGLITRFGEPPGDPPLKGEELLRLAREVWPDPALRSRLMRGWSEFARAKFAEVEREARAAPSGGGR